MFVITVQRPSYISSSFHLESSNIAGTLLSDSYRCGACDPRRAARRYLTAGCNHTIAYIVYRTQTHGVVNAIRQASRDDVTHGVWPAVRNIYPRSVAAIAAPDAVLPFRNGRVAQAIPR